MICKNSTEKPSQEKAPGRIIGHIESKVPGPIVIFFGGIHGNEPAGVRALEQLFRDLDNTIHCGCVYGIRGNLKALKEKVRFIEEDLNRLWTPKNLQRLAHASQTQLSVEEIEALDLYELISEILTTHKGPFYFIDLHTTSSKTVPFITINDALINRKFSRNFPVPVVLGIEEFLEGPLLSFINQMGYVSLGFEAGQHIGPEAIKNSLAFIKLTLLFTSVVAPSQKTKEACLKQLSSSAGNVTKLYEVNDVYKLHNGINFEMFKGYESFQPVKKGMPLARVDGKIIYTEKDTTLFMPLYQKKGSEGYFLIRKIPKLFLGLSALLRHVKMDGLLVFLPGVSWESAKKEALRVNLRTARFLTKPIFHLLGYRSWQTDSTHIIMYNRERTAKKKLYRKSLWFK